MLDVRFLIVGRNYDQHLVHLVFSPHFSMMSQISSTVSRERSGYNGSVSTSEAIRFATGVSSGRELLPVTCVVVDTRVEILCAHKCCILSMPQRSHPGLPRSLQTPPACKRNCSARLPFPYKDGFPSHRPGAPGNAPSGPFALRCPHPHDAGCKDPWPPGTHSSFRWRPHILPAHIR